MSLHHRKENMKNYGIPDDILSDYLNVLVIASSTQYGVRDDKWIRRQMSLLANLLGKIAKKHLSDGQTTEDRKKFCIEVLETALQIATGKMDIQPE